MDDGGVLRVGGTRVTLDTVVQAFAEGTTPEEIVQQYPSLRLADVYYVIGYYLDHVSDVALYIQQREQSALSVRELNEAKFDPIGIRDRLLARRGR